MNIFTDIIAKELQIIATRVDNVLILFSEGCTIPFIARYRKERTGGMDEVQITAISNLNDKLTEIAKRKETIIKTIDDQNKLTPELRQRIDNCWDANTLEDIYLPYKPRRRTRAQVAREQGLEPLAAIILLQRDQNIEYTAKRFVKGDVKTVEDALKGAQDIIAEQMSENEATRNAIRGMFRRTAIITSKVVKTKKDSDESAKYSDYFDWSEPLKRCTSHRLLAMRRGESEGILKVSISIDQDEAEEKVCRQYITIPRHSSLYDFYSSLIGDAVCDGLKRLLLPQIETEFAALSKEKADTEAIKVFAENLRQLLLGAPLGQKRVLGIDPGFRTGCKIVCLDSLGTLLYHTVLFLSNQKGGDILANLIHKYEIEAIAIGNGTASRETTDYVRSILNSLLRALGIPKGDASLEGQKNGRVGVSIFVVSEDGASVYSASKVARDEFPDEDVTVRGAVSIARRLMDPLAELVKIDPKSIGVGQYQHDVDQKQLKQSLDQTVVSCVNLVGVDVNTASQHLLTYVSGLGPTLAKNIVDYRTENGPFTSRAQLKKVPRLGPAAFEQCAGFLRVSGAKNPLDNSAVHPESYHLVEEMAKEQGVSIKELIGNTELLKKITPKNFTQEDILKELAKPGRDPREQIEAFEFDPTVKTPDDLIPGMILPGIVTNITNFGAFVDVGVHQDGLVHVSQLADRFVSDPTQIVHLHQQVRVRVLEVDRIRKRISLSMKNV